MRSMRLKLFALLAPMLALALVLAAGCGDKKGSDTKGSGDGGSADGTKPSDGGKKTAIEAKSRGTLKGKAVLVGDAPSMASADAALQEKMTAFDKEKGAHCLPGATDEEKAAFEWRVDPKTKGVANVIVWLAPPDGFYFKLSDADKKPARAEVVFHQPHCAFMPHCDVAFTHYTEGGKLVPTGQKVVFKNDAGTAHNTDYKGLLVQGANKLLNPGQSISPDDMKPDRKEITLSCQIHPWMRAYLRDFDHPFAAVTDNEGNFEIKNVPAGVDVHLVAWHEKAGFVLGDKGKKVTLKEGDNTEEIKVTPK